MVIVFCVTFVRMKRLDKEILYLALPSIVSNVTVPLLGMVDLGMAGHIGNERHIGAIAVGSMLFNVMYWLLGFLRMGTSGLTSQALGRKNLSDAGAQWLRALTIAVVLGLLLIILQMPLLRIGLAGMSPSPSVAELVHIYFSVCIWGAPAVLGLYALTGWFIGMQNTRIPMWVALVQNVVNIAASLFFVSRWQMGIAGVALGTLVAQWTGFVLALSCCGLFYNKVLGKVRGELRTILSPGAFKGFFAVNRDIFLRTLFLVGVNLFFTSAGAREGNMILSANTLLLTLFTFFSYVLDGFAFAGEALAGKAYGAGNGEALSRLCKRLLWWGAGLAVAFTLVYAVGGKAFLGLLTDKPQVVAAAMPYFPWALLIPAAGVAAFVYDGIFIGLTATRGMLLSTATAAFSFFLLYGSLHHVLGNHGLWLAFCTFLAVRGLVEWMYLRSKKLCFL